MANKIRVSSNAFEAFEKEVKLSLEDKKRTLMDVTDKEVWMLLRNPGCEIEIEDLKTKKITGIIAAGLGGVGFTAAAAAAAGTVLTGSVATSGLVYFAAASSGIPGVGWIIGGSILSITAVTSTVFALTSIFDKKKVEKSYNEKVKVYQDAIKKLNEEIRKLKKANMEFSKRYEYLVSILDALQPEGATANF